MDRYARHMKEMREIEREHTSDHELRRREFDFLGRVPVPLPERRRVENERRDPRER